jgi:hypothetical protein
MDAWQQLGSPLRMALLIAQTPPEPPRAAGLFDSAEPAPDIGAVEEEEITAAGSGEFGEDEEDEAA